MPNREFRLLTPRLASKTWDCTRSREIRREIRGLEAGFSEDGA
jgi:hypothetical protein